MVNFLAREYRDDGGKTGGWVVWNVWNIRNVQDIPNVWNIPFVILLKFFVQSVKLDKKCIICYTYNRRTGYYIV